MIWIRQDEFSSTTVAALRRTHYLSPLRGVIRIAIQDYIRTHREGEDVTLAALRAIGEHNLHASAALPPGRSFNRAKQDAGLLVAQILVEIYGPTRVFTLRRNDRKSIASRRNTEGDLTWVTCHAAHSVDHGDKKAREARGTSAADESAPNERRDQGQTGSGRARLR